MTDTVIPARGLLPRLRQSWTVTWPLLVGSLSSLFLTVADTAILGQYDTRELTAMTIAAPLVLVTTAILSPIGSATQILAAQWTGGGQRERLNALMRNAARYGVALGVGAMLLVGITSPWLLPLLGGDLADSTGAQSVLVLLLPTIPLVVVTAVGRGWLVGLGKTRASMHLTVVVNLANIAFDLVLVFGADLGATGSAIGTSAAAAIGVFAMVRLIRQDRPAQHVQTTGKPSAGETAQLRRIAWPDMVFGAVAYGSDALVIAAVSRLDAVSLAAYRTIGATAVIAFVIAYTISNSCSMLVGQRLGANDQVGAKAWAAPMTTLMTIGITISGGAALVAPDRWFSLFSSDRAVVEAAVDQRWMWMLILPAMGVSMMLAGIIRASGDTRSMMWIGVLSQGVFAAPTAWLLAVYLDWDLAGVTTAVTAGWLLRAVLSLSRAKFGPTWQLQPDLADTAKAPTA